MKVAEPLVRGWAPARGSPPERFSRSSDAPCAGCGEQQAADGAPSTTSGRSRSCCRSWSEHFLGLTGLYFPAAANMFPAALLLALVLVLGVRVCADSMEAPSGKRTEHAGDAERAPASLPSRTAAVNVRG